MDALVTLVMSNLLVPGFAAGLLLGASLMYFAISKGFVMTPKLAELKAHIVGLEGKIDRLQSDLERLSKESEDFFRWRKDREKDALRDL